MRVEFAEVNGRRVRYLTEGSGPVLLLLHPVGHFADLFLRNVDELASAFKVVAPDLPGHGFSDAIDFRGRPPQVETVVWLQALLDRLECNKFAAAGSSYGALLAALLCEADNRSFAQILIGSGSVFHETEQQRTTLRGTRDNVAEGMRDPSIDNCRRRIANIVFSPASVPEEILLSRATSLAQPDRLANFVETVDALAESDSGSRVIDRLESLYTPTLVIAGKDDIRAKVELHEVGAARLPVAKLLIYENCGHLPFMEHATRFNVDALTFLRSQL
jgi:pimeloyl-ACP methyl ester carboxylesterase